MKTDMSHLLLVGALGVAIFASSSLVILQSSVPNQSAFATFPGENGKIAFISTRDGNYEIYVMNPDGSEQTRLTNNPTIDQEPDWSPDGTKIVFVREGSGGGTNEIGNSCCIDPTSKATNHVQGNK
jgi:Tol biopolymer transport system component